MHGQQLAAERRHRRRGRPARAPAASRCNAGSPDATRAGAPRRRAGSPLSTARRSAARCRPSRRRHDPGKARRGADRAAGRSTTRKGPASSSRRSKPRSCARAISAAPFAPASTSLYAGNSWRTSTPSSRSAAGSAALTSPSPPVFVSGAHSGVTKSTRIRKAPAGEPRADATYARRKGGAYARGKTGASSSLVATAAAPTRSGSVATL